jgi:hypothetical protein
MKDGLRFVDCDMHIMELQTSLRPIWTCNLTPQEYFWCNCWASVEESEPEIAPTAHLISADRMCISTDYPHFDSNFPKVSSDLLLPTDQDATPLVHLGSLAVQYVYIESSWSSGLRWRLRPRSATSPGA